MSGSLQGSDPNDLRDFARALEQAQNQLLRTRSELSQRISNNLRWEGPDAFVFRHAWTSSYAPVISQVAAMMADTARTLKAQAAEQEAASA